MGKEMRKFMIVIVTVWLIIAAAMGFLTYKVLHSITEKGLENYIHQIWEGEKNENKTK